MISDLGHLLHRLGTLGTAGRRPRVLQATVVATNDRDGGTSVQWLNGSSVVITGLRSSSTYSPALHARVRVEAVGTDHTIVSSWDQ